MAVIRGWKERIAMKIDCTMTETLAAITIQGKDLLRVDRDLNLSTL